MIKMECKSKKGKVHAVRLKMDCATNLMLCGIAQQKPFCGSGASWTCYGEWEETDKEITCKKCKAIYLKTAFLAGALVARVKFKKGQRVWLSVDGMKHFGLNPRGLERWRGKVVGFSTQSENFVKVVKDGNKTAYRYHMNFWTRTF